MQMGLRTYQGIITFMYTYTLYNIFIHACPGLSASEQHPPDEGSDQAETLKSEKQDFAKTPKRTKEQKNNKLAY